MSKAKNVKADWNPGFAAAYERFSGLYDPLARRLSGGLVQRAKAVHSEFLRPGSRVFYPGVGSGSELSGALRRGARVTGIDASPGMLALARERFGEDSQKVELIEGNALGHHRPDTYDVLAAHFFLNLFDEVGALRALQILARQLKPGAQVFVADFAAAGGVGTAIVRYAYYAPINLAGRILGLAELHTLHEYAEYFPQAGIEPVARRALGFNRGPPLFEVWVGRKL